MVCYLAVSSLYHFFEIVEEIQFYAEKHIFNICFNLFCLFDKKNMFFLCPICEKIVLLAKINSALKAGSVSQEIKEKYFFFEKYVFLRKGVSL